MFGTQKLVSQQSWTTIAPLRANSCNSYSPRTQQPY